MRSMGSMGAIEWRSIVRRWAVFSVICVWPVVEFSHLILRSHLEVLVVV